MAFGLNGAAHSKFAQVFPNTQYSYNDAFINLLSDKYILSVYASAGALPKKPVSRIYYSAYKYDTNEFGRGFCAVPAGLIKYSDSPVARLSAQVNTVTLAASDCQFKEGQDLVINVTWEGNGFSDAVYRFGAITVTETFPDGTKI